MSVKYEILKRIVKLIGLKNAWSGKSAVEIVAQKKKENAKNKIPPLSDPEFEITQIRVMGYVVIRMIHRQKTSRANLFIIGGGMAYTFLKAKDINIGKSILDEESIDFCKNILANYSDKIVLPVDNVVTTEFSNDTPNRVANVGGPLGVYEFSNYTNGTERVLEKLVTLNATTILGGGDIVAAATKLGYKDKVTHASTGGGVTLEFMEGKELPGVVSISE